MDSGGSKTSSRGPAEDAGQRSVIEHLADHRFGTDKKSPTGPKGKGRGATRHGSLAASATVSVGDFGQTDVSNYLEHRYGSAGQRTIDAWSRGSSTSIICCGAGRQPAIHTVTRNTSFNGPASR